MTDGVGEQVPQQLLDSNRIGIDHQSLRRRFELQRDGLRGSLGGVPLDDPRGQRPQVGRCPVEAQLPGIGQRQGGQIIHQPIEHQRLVQHRQQVVLRGGIHPVSNALQPGAHHSQWRAQLVGYVGCHLASELLGALEAACHLIERKGELAQLIAAAFGDSPSKIPAGDRARRRRQVANRPQDRSSQQATDHDRQRSGHHRGHPQRLTHPPQELLLRRAGPDRPGHNVANRAAVDHYRYGALELHRPKGAPECAARPGDGDAGGIEQHQVSARHSAPHHPHVVAWGAQQALRPFPAPSILVVGGQ